MRGGTERSDARLTAVRPATTRQRGHVEATVSERIRAARERLARACARTGRPVESVHLVAVSRSIAPAGIRAAAECGLETFGETHVREAAQKIPRCPDRLSWHMIGRLRQAHVAGAVALFEMVHRVDSADVLEALDEACRETGRRMAICVEVNVAGRGSRNGLPPPDVPAFLDRCSEMTALTVTGLSTVPPVSLDAERTRFFFSALRAYREQWREETGFDLPDLAMGTTRELETAVEEGATWIWLTSVLDRGTGSGRAGAAEPGSEDGIPWEKTESRNGG